MVLSKQRFFSLLIIFIAAFSSCNSNGDVENGKEFITNKPLFEVYPYTLDLELYLKQFSVSSTYDTTFFVPLNTCEKCVKNTLESLYRNNYQDLLIIGGKDDSNESFKTLIAQINRSATVIRDTSYQMLQYNIDVFGPTLMLKSNGKVKYTHIDYQSLPYLLERISWKGLPEN